MSTVIGKKDFFYASLSRIAKSAE